MPPARYYSSTAVSTTLLLAIGTEDTQLQVASNSGFPVNFPFTLIIEKDSANEEIVTVTGQIGLAYAVDRGVDGTSPRAHSNGVSVEHGVSALDFTDFRAHESGMAGVHGLGQYEEVVGTTAVQTISNKTYGSDTNAGGYRLTNLANPTADGDAANKAYVELRVQTSDANAAAAAASAVAAAASATSSSNYAAQAAATYDQFDDRYLGAKSADPALDNDGNSLQIGALYFSTNARLMRVYTGSTYGWQYVAADTSAFIEKNVFSNVGDLIVGAGSAQLSTLPVGNDGQALLADSTAAEGIAWTNFGPAFFGFTVAGNGDLNVVVDQTTAGGPYNVEDYNEWVILPDDMNITINASGHLVLS
jgi:hypothetical protein